jgi:hypothetical protein
MDINLIFLISSGVVVLVFGSTYINQSNEQDLYNTSSVYLYDTNTNELYPQKVSGNSPKPRASASGTLGNNK